MRCVSHDAQSDWIGSSRRAAAGIGMRVRIVMSTQTRQRALLIIDVTCHVQITVHLDRSVILQLDEAAGLVHQPQFADRRRGRCALRPRTRVR